MVEPPENGVQIVVFLTEVDFKMIRNCSVKISVPSPYYSTMYKRGRQLGVVECKITRPFVRGRSEL